MKKLSHPVIKGTAQGTAAAEQQAAEASMDGSRGRREGRVGSVDRLSGDVKIKLYCALIN